jgi:hypothetical protein
VLSAVRAAYHRHGLPALGSPELGSTSLDLSVVLRADTHAVRTTCTASHRGVAAKAMTGVNLAAWSGVGLLNSCLHPIRNRDDLGNHTADAPAVWTLFHVLGPKAGSAAAAAVFGTTWMLLIAAAAGHLDVPDGRLLAPAAPEGVGGHGAVCGGSRPAVQQCCPVQPTGLPLPLFVTARGGGPTVEERRTAPTLRPRRPGPSYAGPSFGRPPERCLGRRCGAPR